MSHQKYQSTLNRRQFIQFSSGAALSAGLGKLNLARAQRANYSVGIGQNSNPYAATMRAVHASSGWKPARVNGKRVIIKPNLVKPLAANTGVTTDPEVVRAIVDLALASNAAEVWIVETSTPDGEPYFQQCGYDFFNSYDPRVSLVDLASLPYSMAPVPNGMAYSSIAMPVALFGENAFLVSVGKMKVHNLTMVSLSTKNMFGFPPVAFYTVPQYEGRYGLHNRSINESIVDLNLARRPDFAVVDGMWALEGMGPWGGTPRQMDLVLAGDNALAVDYVCLLSMGIPAMRVAHLIYATLNGLGPAGLGEIDIHGDPLTPVVFETPVPLPTISPPQASPFSFDPRAGEQTQISFQANMPCMTQVEIVQAQPFDTDLPQIRLLRPFGPQSAGMDSITWDGRDNDGNFALPGTFGVRIAARSYMASNIIYSFGWVTVANPNG